jgi:hypothetical protein
LQQIALDGFAERHAGRKEVLLADELLERTGTHALGQGRGRFAAGGRRIVGKERGHVRSANRPEKSPGILLEPTDDKRSIVQEDQRANFQACADTHARQIGPELSVAVGDTTCARNLGSSRPSRRTKPITHDADGERPVVLVGPDVLARDIGTKHLVAVRFAVENEAYLPPLARLPEPFRTQKHTELQGHVETWQSSGAVKRRPRQIVNAILTFRNNSEDLIEPDDAAVVTLQSTAGDKATVVDCEHKRFEKRAIVLIEGNVEEDSIAVAWRRQSQSQTDLDLPLRLEGFDDRDFLVEAFAVFFDRLAPVFDGPFGRCTAGSTVAGANWNPKMGEPD